MNDTNSGISIYIDDAVFYYSTSSTIDLTAPSSPTSASATETEISWNNGSDTGTGATGIQKTLIFHRTKGSVGDNDLSLNPQGIYSLTSTEGPSKDQSGNWELIDASVAADATSKSGDFTAYHEYAIVHRDLAYNYSTPAYVTVTPAGPSLTVDPATASAFSYLAGFGPSARQTFGLTLANSSKAITATLTGDYEMSTDGETYSSSAIEDLTDGSMLYVRLKGNLSSGDHDGTLTFSNDDLASDVVIDLDGSVLASSTVTFANAVGATGIAPAAQTVETGTNITLPKNFTMYKADYTFSGWDADGDGDVDYEGGDSYPVTDDATLTAVFESNGGTTLADRTGATTIRFDFQRGNGAPTVQWGEGSGAKIWVAQATVAGKTIDVKADINVTASGKFNNASWTDWVQINNTTEITVPSVEGAVVNVRAYDASNASTVNSKAHDSYASYIYTYNITSDAATAQFVANSGEGSGYYKYIEVVLPGPTYDVDFTLTGVTKTTGDTTVEGGTEYTATFAAVEDYVLPTTITVTAGGSDITANCTWAKATGSLTIPAEYVTGDIAITIEGVAVAGTSMIKAVLQSSSSATITGTVGGSYTADSQVQPRDNEKGGCKLGKDGAWVCITLTSGWKFKAGDIVKVNIGTAGTAGTFAFYKESAGTNAILTTDEGPTAGLHTFVLPAAANNEASLYLVRKASSNFNPYVDYIEVIRPNAVVTLNASGYSTYSKGSDFTFEGAKAYKMALDLSAGTLVGTEISGKIPAGEGILLKGDASAVVAITNTTGASAIAGNNLHGTTDSDGNLVSVPAGKTIYVLSGDTFKKYTGATFAANKAFFQADGTTVESSTFAITFDDENGEATSIKGVEAQKFMENNKFYNLNGQKVQNPTKGLYIVNGRKVVIK